MRTIEELSIRVVDSVGDDGTRVVEAVVGWLKRDVLQP